MTIDPMNLVFILSDEHNREMTGCYGHSVVKTPNLDMLSSEGVRFTNAYANCPICVPSRASLATGQYVHKIRNWDNAAPYTGTVPSWGHRLTQQGFHVTTIGKLHYRQDNDDTGFPDMRLSLHVMDGMGDSYSLIRDNLQPRVANREKIYEAGRGESSYIRYDRAISNEAVRFLHYEAKDLDKPWVLFVSLVTPHFPLIAPQEYYDLYQPENVILPKQYSLSERPKHPAIEQYRHVWATQDEFDELTIRNAVAAYYGLCSFMDAQVGNVLNAIKEAGLSDSTRIIYTSDHGDTLGSHGVWFKSTMYEGSVAVPFLMAGPGVPAGMVCNEHISLVDCYPTILEAVGTQKSLEDVDLPGRSLWSIVNQEPVENVRVFSEYHAAGFTTGTFMIRVGKYKYVYYVGYQPQLFDVEKDPNELNDLTAYPEYCAVLIECERELRNIVDPEQIDRLAKEDQTRKIDELGGREKILREGLKIPYSPVPSQFR
ncbi:MAG: sulfatase-like hydrolase/transferase [Bacilli bacterium]